jgi:hypothetical protein
MKNPFWQPGTRGCPNAAVALTHDERQTNELGSFRFLSRAELPTAIATQIDGLVAVDGSRRKFEFAFGKMTDKKRNYLQVKKHKCKIDTCVQVSFQSP